MFSAGIALCLLLIVFSLSILVKSSPNSEFDFIDIISVDNIRLLKADKTWGKIIYDRQTGYIYYPAYVEKAKNGKIYTTGAVFLLFVLISLYSLKLFNNSKFNRQFRPEKSFNDDHDIQSQVTNFTPDSHNFDFNQNLTPEEKGIAFEKFIVRKLNKNKLFKLLHWRGDKIDSETGIYPEENTYPDLVVKFSLNEKQVKLAIECKWRKTFFKDSIDIGKSYQIINYKKYQDIQNQPVFVAIGVGGTPSNPKQLFIVPVNDFEDNKISAKLLFDKYRKKPDTDFYYDIDTNSLN
mgnify:FL=1|jgi:hypothetical protein